MNGDELRQAVDAALPSWQDRFGIQGAPNTKNFDITGDGVSGYGKEWSILAAKKHPLPTSAVIKQVVGWDDGWLIALDGALLVDDSGQPMSNHDDGVTNTEVNPGFTITASMGLKSGSVIQLWTENWPGSVYSYDLGGYVCPYSYSPWTITVYYDDGSSVSNMIGSYGSGIDPANEIGTGTTVIRANGSYTVP